MTISDYLSQLRTAFPSLRPDNCRLTSPSDESYNCIAWATGDTERWWWPDALRQDYWPPEAPRSESLAAFESAFATLGFSQKSDSQLERGTQKVALFASQAGTPTHAARQLSDGWWASKLGREIDIEHTLEAIEGPAYGKVALVLARPVGVA